MNMPFQPPKPENPFAAAVRVLREHGHIVEPAPGYIPGLVLIDGHRELGMAQVIDFARQRQAGIDPR